MSAAPLLVCRRFLQKPYSRYLPQDWYVDDPRELASNDPAARIREFFAAVPGARA